DELRHDPPARRGADRSTSTPTETRPTPPRPGPDAVPTVAATRGLALTAPGGVAATVVRPDRTGAERSLVVEVGGAWAPLALDAPVAGDGQRVRLQLPATRVAPTAPRAASPGSGRLLAPADGELDGDDAIRFEALRTWRTEQARS